MALPAAAIESRYAAASLAEMDSSCAVSPIADAAPQALAISNPTESTAHVTELLVAEPTEAGGSHGLACTGWTPQCKPTTFAPTTSCHLDVFVHGTALAAPPGGMARLAKT